jgi:hypothetical protein
MFSSDWGYGETEGGTITFTPLELMVVEHALIEGGIKRMETIRSVLGDTAVDALVKACEKIAEAIENQ